MAAGRRSVVRNILNGMWGFQIELFLLAISYCNVLIPQTVYCNSVLGKNGLQICYDLALITGVY